MSIDKIEQKYRYSNFYHGASNSTKLCDGPAYLCSVAIIQGTTTGQINIDVDSNFTTTGAYASGTATTPNLFASIEASRNVHTFECVVPYLGINATTTASISFMVIWRPL